MLGDSPFREGALSGFLLILFSELGDKTFFIAVLLALKESRSVVFAGTFGALGVMTVISVGYPLLLMNPPKLVLPVFPTLHLLTLHQAVAGF